MSASLAFNLAVQLLAFIVTLSVLLLLLFWGQWRIATGRILFQFVGSLIVLQAGTLLIQTGVWAEVDHSVVEAFVSVALIGFFLVTLTLLALLLQAAQSMKEAWELVCRSGVAALVVLQPALWKHGLFMLSPLPDDKAVFNSAYTSLGKIIASFCVIYSLLIIYVGWHYWRRIDAPLLSGPVIGMAAVQVAALSAGTLHALSWIGIVGGVVSALLGYFLVRQSEIVPQDLRSVWVRAIRDISESITGSQPANETLAGIAEYARRLVRTDAVIILLAIGPDRLEVTANAGHITSVIGRQIRIGEGLAGRVMQTLQPMRVEHYRNWEGRSVEFDDMPFYASLSVPLIYEGTVVGVIDVYEMTPGRIFNDRDQLALELLVPHTTMTIVKARLQRELQAVRGYFQTVISHTTSAVLIYDSAGILREMNPAGQHYLRLLFGEAATTPTLVELAAQAQTPGFIDSLAQWAADPMGVHKFGTQYEPLGPVIVQLQTVPTGSLRSSDLMVMMRALDEEVVQIRPAR